MLPKVKICGVTQAEVIKHLDNLGVSYAGLWHGIPEGKYNLSLAELTALTSIPVQNVSFTMVTLNSELDFLSQAIELAHINAIQFHGFTLPSVIEKIKHQYGHSIEILKVIHIKDNQCLEGGFIQRYIDAGCDALILDSYQDNTRIGSTGIRLEQHVITDFVSTWGNQISIMIAGGLSENTIPELITSTMPFGIDIDSAARHNGIINRERVTAIMTSVASASMPRLETTTVI
ncbi:phosphoribosylanthranilate isomerase [Maricurvus nonylphenolicus]|uniref:phosphoribosylanthranilate isomerase n=1 Tax=Maricurvus nonylphenolicus TaxID=1008307 RepID=UPI0036F24B0B